MRYVGDDISVRTYMLAKCTALTPLSACYFQYPHDLKRSPPLKGGADARIEIHDEDGVHYLDCEKGHTDACIWHKGRLVLPWHYTTTNATYDGKPVTRGEISTLVEPDRQAAKYAEMEKYKSTCSLSLVPSVIFAAGALADLGGFAATQLTSSDAATYVLIGGAIAMVAGAALSYPIGGYACNAGRDTAQRNGISDDNATVWVTYEDDAGAIALQRAVEVMRTSTAFRNKGRASWSELSWLGMRG